MALFGKSKTSRPSPRRSKTLWWLAAFFSAGFILTILFKNPVMALGVLPVMAAPVGSRTKKVWVAMLLGAAYGLVGGTGAVSALFQQYPAIGLATAPDVARTSMPATMPASVSAATASAPATSQASTSAGTTSAPSSTSAPTSAPTTAPVALTPEQLARLAALKAEYRRGTVIYLLTPAGMCALFAGVFSWLAARRRRRIDDEWR